MWEKIRSKRVNPVDLIIGVVAILVSVSIVLTVAITAAFTVPACDDMLNGAQVRGSVSGPVSLIITAVKFSIDSWLHWQGTYFASFINVIFEPMRYDTLAPMRIFMVCHAILLFMGFFYVIWQILESLAPRRRLMISILCMVPVTISMTCFRDYKLLYFWYNAASVHSFPFALLMFGLGTAIMAQRTGHKAYIAISAILGFMAMGGSLDIAGTGCYLMLLGGCYQVIAKKKLPPAGWFIIAGSWLFGALLNACAPGNFTRHVIVASTGVQPVVAVRDAVIMVLGRFSYFWASSPFAVVMVGFVAIGLFVSVSESVSKVSYLIVSLMSMFTPIIAAYPMALGYGMPHVPDQAGYVIDATILMVCYNIGILVGIHISMLRYEVPKRLIAAILMIIALTSIVNDDYRLTDIRVPGYAQDIVNGTYMRYARDVDGFLASLEGKSGDVTVPYGDFPFPPGDLFVLTLSEDPAEYSNQSLATYFGLDSIRLGE